MIAPRPDSWPPRTPNFIAKFDIDDGETTDLALEAKDYDTSPSAEYESWMLLEPADANED